MSTREERKVTAARYHASKAAQMLGRKGGQVTSPAKAATARENGKLGGRPAKRRQTGARDE